MEIFNRYIEKGVILFTCVFFDVSDTRPFSQEVIPEVI